VQANSSTAVQGDQKIEIQAIYNGKSARITMQGVARTREKPSTQETMGINAKTMGINGKTMRRNGPDEPGLFVGYLEPSSLAFGKAKDRFRETHPTRLQARFKKYRRFTGHRCALNTEEAIEIAKKKVPALNRRITGRETGKNRTGNRKNRAMDRTIAPAAGKPKRARSGGAPDAQMSLCTYCHAPLAPAMQAEFDLSPLFGGMRSAPLPTLRRIDLPYAGFIPNAFAKRSA
jgi:hypothetical protein